MRPVASLILFLPLSFWPRSFVCFFPSQRVNLSFDFPFYGHFLREITVATGGKWTLFLDSVLPVLILTSVIIGHTVCAWHIRLYTDSFIAAGFRRKCGKIYKISLEDRGIYEMYKKKRVCLCESDCVSGTWCTCERGIATLHRDLTSEYGKGPNKDHFLCTVSGKVNHKQQGWKGSGTVNHQSARYKPIYSSHLRGTVC